MGNMNVSWCTDPTDCEICASARVKLEALIKKEQEKLVKEMRDIAGHPVTIERTRGWIMGYPDIFWNKKTTFSCTDCGYVMTGIDHTLTKTKRSEVHETEMSFFTCPQCGKEAIVLWWYKRTGVIFGQPITDARCGCMNRKTGVQKGEKEIYADYRRHMHIRAFRLSWGSDKRKNSESTHCRILRTLFLITLYFCRMVLIPI